ncbi:DUF4062 domain-containing protein [Neobacillus notoginsengisoli]|uniref:DUF4062 domain-containing protein n=1 Tax=Neobacillus notoginsengisoli TaxID=1578198 RepID=A0A417YGY0_9BACI|nr:DUF4062 domain-containing protein [Neobacillus notoginsengisoli]RHW32127.1 DUF4062 domain-containing protein [Neobacillus notoginsengisoli]
MAEPTKIFISSAAESGLGWLRESVHAELRAMEHHPQMYEKDFGPWPVQNLVGNCIEHVLRCDIFLLFISHKAGNFSDRYKATVTHVEFQKAHQNNKNIIVFVHDEIYRIFWNDLRWVIAELIEAYKESHHGMEPDSYRDIAEEAWSNYPGKSESIDSYIWGFLYDIYQKGHYLEQISLGVDGVKTIKRYFSDLFRQGSKYLALKTEIEEQIAEGPTYRKHAEFTSQMIGYLRNGELQNPRMFLEYLQRYLKSGIVFTKPGTVFERVLGEYESCSGSTLYKKNDLKLQLVAASGMASDDNAAYDLGDKSSYVVKAFDSQNPELFYSEEKRQFYLAIQSGNYVICFHYPVDSFWTEETMRRFKGDIMRDIMETEPALFRNFAIKLLGGIK